MFQVVFAHLILARLQPLLSLLYALRDQTIRLHQRQVHHAILALRLLSDHHREFSTSLHIAYILKSSLVDDSAMVDDSVDRPAPTFVWVVCLHQLFCIALD